MKSLADALVTPFRANFKTIFSTAVKDMVGVKKEADLLRIQSEIFNKNAAAKLYIKWGKVWIEGKEWNTEKEWAADIKKRQDEEREWHKTRETIIDNGVDKFVDWAYEKIKSLMKALSVLTAAYLYKVKELEEEVNKIEELINKSNEDEDRKLEAINKLNNDAGILKRLFSEEYNKKHAEMKFEIDILKIQIIQAKTKLIEKKSALESYNPYARSIASCLSKDAIIKFM